MPDPAITPYEKQILLSHILQKPREYILAHPEIILSKDQKHKLDQLVQRRLKHEPMAYILGQKGFYGLDFSVNRNVLIPRPETEHLVEEILKSNPKNSVIIDIGTGSGNIIISLAKNVGVKNYFFATDISQKSLHIAKRNAKKYKLNKKIKFIQTNLLGYFLKNNKILKHNKIIIAANLPYLSKKIYASSMLDVKKYEPKSALLSKFGGLDHYKKLFWQIKFLKKRYSAFHAECYIEFSPEQKLKISTLAKYYFPKSNSKFIKDLSGKWRIFILKL